ncbi:MAG TPA: helix-turn-helix domain-containing protein [Symbiobacteriaceae bacterium]|nr:helix-turn-helix domain-containing protein [Symbiobacteriaceae bacterium]
MYREIKPDPRLAPFVRCFWCMERDYGIPGAHEVVWPDGKTELLLLVTGDYTCNGDLLPRNLLIGPLTRPVTLTAPGVVRLAGVRFHPWGFWPFFGAPVHRLRDRLLPYPNMAVPPDIAEGLAALEQHLLARMAENHPLVAPMARAVLDSEGMLPVAELEERSGVSARHLERLFQEVVGLTPKRLSVIIRFDKARRALFRNPDVSLTEVASQMGYYDQSHFIRDFRTHFGMTPGEFREWVLRQRATLFPATRVGFVQVNPT